MESVKLPAGIDKEESERESLVVEGNVQSRKATAWLKLDVALRRAMVSHVKGQWELGKNMPVDVTAVSSASWSSESSDRQDSTPSQCVVDDGETLVETPLKDGRWEVGRSVLPS